MAQLIERWLKIGELLIRIDLVRAPSPVICASKRVSFYAIADSLDIVLLPGKE